MKALCKFGAALLAAVLLALAAWHVRQMCALARVVGWWSDRAEKQARRKAIQRRRRHGRR